MTHFLRLLTAGLLSIALAGCETFGAGAPVANIDDAATTATIQAPGDVKYYPSDEPLRLGEEYFNRGIYGTAEEHFQKAVEKAPKDPSAWIGLAASYDRLGRFDLADRAYQQAGKLTGETMQILNNEGYSLMLRGKLAAAREKFTKAYRLEPENPTVLNNINLLNASYRFIEHGP
jgi:Flp pilus assembly protein TadD